MVVVYVPEDKRWQMIGQGLGGLLSGWAQGRVDQQVGQQISQMSQDPQYTNNPTKLYGDIGAKWGQYGQDRYLKSLDAGLKLAETQYYKERYSPASAALTEEDKRLRIQRLRQQIEEAKQTDPLKAQKLQAELENEQRRARVGGATESEQIEKPKLDVKKKRQEVESGAQDEDARRRLLAPPKPEDEDLPPGPGGALQMPGEASRQLAQLAPTGPEDQVVDAAGRPIQRDPRVVPASYMQYADAGTPSVSTAGPAPAPPGSGAPGPGDVMPSLVPSLVPSLTTPPPAPVSAPRGPALVPGPNMGAPQAAQRALSPQADAAPATLTAPPAASPAPPPGSAMQAMPDSGLRPPQPRGLPAAGTQDQPLGLPLPESDEYARQAEAVKKNINREMRDYLSSMGIKHPQEQLEVYNAASQASNKDFSKVLGQVTKRILDRHAHQAEHGYSEAATQSRHLDDLAQRQYQFDQNQYREEYQFMMHYGKPEMMKPVDATHLASALNILVTNQAFLKPGAPTGGIMARWKDWLAQKTNFIEDPAWLSMSTDAHQQQVSAATTGGGLAGGGWRTRNAELITPSELHQNYVNIMMIQSNAAREMESLKVMYWQYAGKPGQEQNADMVAKAYNATEAEFKQADTLWWGKDVSPDGKSLIGPFHYFYMGTPVDRNLKEVPGGPKLLPDDTRYKNRMTNEVKDGAALNKEARTKGMIPEAYLRVYSWGEDRSGQPQ